MLFPFGDPGRRAEALAARHLRRRGYHVLARNLRCGRHEIDILARKGPLLVVVEVRFRSEGVLAADRSVGAAKARSLRRGFENLRRRLGLPPGTPVRFDLVLVTPDRGPVHVRGAL